MNEFEDALSDLEDDVWWDVGWELCPDCGLPFNTLDDPSAQFSWKLHCRKCDDKAQWEYYNMRDTWRRKYSCPVTELKRKWNREWNSSCDDSNEDAE